LPEGLEFDPSVPTPESVLGWEVGDWHVRHDQLVQYMQAVAAASPRVSVEITGYTHEQRPLLLLSITAAGNQDNLENLRQAHLDDSNSGPLVVWQGYSVHGNEASGSNAALLFVYYLAAAQDSWLESVLEGTVILIEPSINPDGLARPITGNTTKRGPMAEPTTTGLTSTETGCCCSTPNQGLAYITSTAGCRMSLPISMNSKAINITFSSLAYQAGKIR
jgi:hypothetical protein